MIHKNISFIFPVKRDLRIVDGVAYIKSFAETNNIDYEIIICGEINPHVFVSERLKIINIYPAKKGKCVREGIFNSKGNIVVVCDTDISISHTDMLCLLELLEDADMVTGNRYIDNKTRIYNSKYRHFASKIFILIVKNIFNIDFDTQCGLKIFKSKIAKKVFLYQIITGLSYDVEIFLRANYMNLKILQKNIAWETCNNSTINLFSSSVSMFIELLYLLFWNALQKIKKIIIYLS